MKNLFLIPLALFSFSCINAQTNFFINYKVKYVESVHIDGKKNSYDRLLKNLSSSFNERNYTLLFNQHQSLYEPNEVMTIDNSKNNSMASIILGKSLIYISNRDSVYFRQKEFIGELHLIKVNFPENEWLITEEKKQILSYTCFKALLRKSNSNNKKVTVVAWFTNDIPTPFGPKGYYGLPGTILELQENNILYYASEIKFNNKTTIKQPLKGIRITEEELEKKAGEAAHQLFGVKRN